MNNLSSESMWSEFSALWPELQAIGAGSVVLAGGYGLFLKQTWLLAHPEVPTIIALAQWSDSTPRGTNDFDFVIGVDLIASAEAQLKVRAVLARHGFKPKDPMWQFEKPLGAGYTIVVDIHAPLPVDGYLGIKVEQRRVKRKPSLGSEGLHGRADPEAVGFNLRSFQFDIEGLLVVTPNPVTWCAMKLTAMRDKRLESEDASLSPEDRKTIRDKAVKHAKDVCRIVAMVTRDERDAVTEVVLSIRETEPFKQAVLIAAEYFQSEAGWGTVVVEHAWLSVDLQLLRQTLASWFQ